MISNSPLTPNQHSQLGDNLLRVLLTAVGGCSFYASGCMKQVP